jgi:hypothetical protein
MDITAPSRPALNTERTLLGLSEQLKSALENCYRCKPIQGSNPCPSAPQPIRGSARTLCLSLRPSVDVIERSADQEANTVGTVHARRVGLNLPVLPDMDTLEERVENLPSLGRIACAPLPGWRRQSAHSDGQTSPTFVFQRTSANQRTTYAAAVRPEARLVGQATQRRTRGLAPNRPAQPENHSSCCISPAPTSPVIESRSPQPGQNLLSSRAWPGHRIVPGN